MLGDDDKMCYRRQGSMEEEQSSDNRQQEKERLYLRGSPDPLSGPEDMVSALDLAGTLGPSGSDH